MRCVLTPAALEFVTPLAVASLSGEPVFQDLFTPTGDTGMDHIRLSREADLVVVAPATADIMGRMAGGLADDLATAILLATDKPVLAAPSMNTRMWENPRRQPQCCPAHRRRRHHGGGRRQGISPCGETGPGRMSEPDAIVDAIAALLGQNGPGPLHGRHVLVTSGPTHEPVDPVRYVGNRSSGKQGHALATACVDLGARVTLVSGPVTLADPPGADVVHVETACDMLHACLDALPADAAVCAAAVADWRVAEPRPAKWKKGAGGAPVLELVENPRHSCHHRVFGKQPAGPRHRLCRRDR